MKKPTLFISNSFTEAKAFSTSDAKIIEETLTYDNLEVIYLMTQIKIQISMAYRFKSFNRVTWLKQRLTELDSQIKICWFKKGSFPTGHLVLVVEALLKAGVDFELTDLRQNLAKNVKYPWVTPSPDLRHYQKAMLEMAKQTHRGVFEACVGSGKTLLAQHLVAEFKVPALILVPAKDLGVQLYESFVEYFGKSKVSLISTDKKAAKMNPIRVCTIQTLTALKKKGLLKDFLKDLGLIYVDEIHHSGATTYLELLPYFDHIYYRFGGSGTFLRNDSKTLDMLGFLSGVLYSYSAAQATREGYLTPLEVTVHDLKGIKGSNYQNEYDRNFCDNEELLLALKNILTFHVEKDAQVLILVGRKDRCGKLIHEFLKTVGIANDYVDGDSDRTDVKKSIKDFNAKKTKVLIGSSILGEGIDIRSTAHLIMCQGGKSEIAVTQAIGRAIRLYPGKKVANVHDFNWLGTKYLQKHLKIRLEIYEKNFGGVINVES